MATLAELLVRVGIDADDLESGVDRAADFVESNFGRITASGVAAGTGLEAFARKQAPLTESLQRTAAAIGEPEDALRALATETSNVTFPLEDVLALMESGRQQSLRTGEELQRFATFWDMVGDATGEAGPALGEAGVALRAVGIAAGEEEQALAAFGFITDSTTSSVSDFLSFLERTGPELRTMGADVDDAAAILGILENEFGLTGRTARQEFRQAVNEADGDMAKMLDTLGISAEQFEQYQGAVASSGEVIERNAAIHAESFTPLQKLGHAAEELMFKHGALADAAGALALPLVALGPILRVVTGVLSGVIKVVPGLIGGLARVGGAFARVGLAALRGAGQVAAAGARMAASAARATARVIASVAVQVARWVFLGVQSLLAAAKVALAWLISLGPIALVIAAVVGLVVLIVRNWETIKNAIRAGWEFVKRITSQAWNAVKTAVRNAVSSLMSTVRGIPGRIVSALGNLGSLLFSAGKNVIQGLIDGIGSMIGAVGRAAGNVVQRVRDFLPFSPAAEGPLRMHPPEEAGAAIAAMLAAGMRDAEAEVVRAAEDIARAASIDGGAGRVRLPGRVPAGGVGTIIIDLSNAVISSEAEFERMVVNALERAGRKGTPVTIRGRPL